MSQIIKVGVIGYGRIGRAIVKFYEHHAMTGPHVSGPKYIATSYDTNATVGANVIVENDKDLEFAVINNDIIICSTPFQINEKIAGFCIRHRKPYFDLTEDNEKAEWVREEAWADGHPAVHVMPQCGLAPGAVSIIANSMMQLFESVDTIEIRVGALPQHANNDMKYYLSWSPDGLINEYNHPCVAIKDGQRVELQPLEGYETIILDGVEYEAFNTSGGLGSLADSLAFNAGVKNINYKTIRYKGHRDRIKFLFDDLNLRNHQQILVDIFKQHVPYVHNDTVIIFIQLTGMINGRREVRQLVRKIDGSLWMSAIELTTAGGVCAAVDWFVNTPSAKNEPVLRNEQIQLEDLKDNFFWTRSFNVWMERL